MPFDGARSASYLDLMTREDIIGTPFHEIVRALAATPHSRRMAGGLLAMFPGIEDGGIIARECASPEFAELFQIPEAAFTPTNFASKEFVTIHFIAAALMRRGLLPKKTVCRYADMVNGLVLSAEMNDTGRPHFQAAMLALGSPLFDGAEELAKRRAAIPISAGSIASLVSDALLGNPAIHGKTTVVEEEMSEKSRYFFENAALFGDLNNEKIIGVLQEKLAGEWGSIPGGRRFCPEPIDRIRNALLSRNDVSPPLIASLYEAPTSTSENLRKLVKMEEHQRMVKAGEISGLCLCTKRPQNACLKVA